MGRSYDYDIYAELRIDPPFIDEAELDAFTGRLEALCFGGASLSGLPRPDTEEPAFSIDTDGELVYANGNTEGAENSTPGLVLGWLRILRAALGEFGRTMHGHFAGEPAETPRHGDGSDRLPAFRIEVDGETVSVVESETVRRMGPPRSASLRP